MLVPGVPGLLLREDQLGFLPKSPNHDGQHHRQPVKAPQSLRAQDF